MMRRRLPRLLRGLLSLAAVLLPVLIPLLLVANFGKPVVPPAPIAVVDTPIRPAASAARNRDDPRAGGVQILPNFEIFDHVRVRSELKRHEPASRSVVFSSNVTGALTFVAAPALDWTLSVPNAYLLGRAPYAVSQAWMPLYAVSDRLRYRLDHDQFSGREEVWLTSMQAWSRAQGDCEDHAILLADWLIELGLDARVVLGKHVREGHAWVVVFKEGKEYLLEATLKKKLKRWSAYPLASMLPDYHPEIMFNRDLLWFNTGSNLTVSYSGSQWRQAVRFLPTEAL